MIANARQSSAKRCSRSEHNDNIREIYRKQWKTKKKSIYPCSWKIVSRRYFRRAFPAPSCFDAWRSTFILPICLHPIFKQKRDPDNQQNGYKSWILFKRFHPYSNKLPLDQNITRKPNSDNSFTSSRHYSLGFVTSTLNNHCSDVALTYVTTAASPYHYTSRFHRAYKK